ncbi:MAG: flagellar biosynthesis protein FlhA [Candidatus Margulisbacteria bacterium GWF2_35_9]|nr:MAG: flagellar biosynthesis protein FlhA [Candidatus Margulisbacteria bacterium GWF2_35_9]
MVELPFIGKITFEEFNKRFPINDFGISILLVAVLAIMIIPMPTFLLDLLMVLNISIGLVILLVAVFLNKPLEFAAFPSILLVTTIFRLALNISSTRLILGLGADFDGKVVKAFAEFVTKGNLVVGGVAFGIITIVQFMVITKGSERVAEVAARFTLDAMPGKQMSIDADLNSGLIDASEAKIKRSEIQKEATFFGSMDGANKFVRGDSVAGIIIVIINIVGGIIIGRFQQGLEMGESLETFAKLTIGDGLVGQIPALLMSISTGLVITKSASEESLGSDIVNQMLKKPNVFIFTGIILYLFAIVPGLPTIPFGLLATGSVALGYFLIKSEAVQEESVSAREEQAAKEAMKKPENLLGTLALDPIALKTGRNLVPLIDPSQNGPLLERITLVRYQIGQDLGFVIPGVRVMDDLSLPPNQYLVDIRGTKVAIGEGYTNAYYVKLSLAELKEKGLDGEEVTDPIDGGRAVWVNADFGDQLQQLGLPVKTIVDYISDHFTEVIKRYADEIMTRQNVQALLELVKNSNAAIVRELVPDMLSLGQVHKVLQNLVRERISIRDLSTILERLADYAHVSRDTNLLAEYIRQSLSRQICGQFADSEDTLTVVTIDPRLEEVMISAIHQSEYGSFLALEPGTGEKVLSQLKEHLKNFNKLKKMPILLCSPRLRPHFKRFIERNYPMFHVLSYNEVVPQIKVQSIGIINE